MPENDTPEADRDRGFCTASQLDYLEGRKELDGSRERQTRYRIRKRAAGAIRELGLLLNKLDRSERKKIGEMDSLDALAFLIQPTIRHWIDAPVAAKNPAKVTRDTHEAFLGYTLANAVERALDAEDSSGSYEVTVDVGITDKDEFAPSAPELEAQLRNDEIGVEEIQDYYDEGYISLRELVELTSEGPLLEDDG